MKKRYMPVVLRVVSMAVENGYATSVRGDALNRDESTVPPTDNTYSVNDGVWDAF